MRNTLTSLLLPFALLVSHLANAEGRLPDGGTATYAKGSVTKAWYTHPTDRYGHGVLGDAIEGGALAVQGKGGISYSYVLDEQLVFEDITPRLADLNGDGSAEVITILSSIKHGGSLAVFALKDQKLQLLAKTSFIGLTRRWLNIAGIADYNGDGKIDIALVKTPHLGGALEFWSLTGSSLTKIGMLNGFSNHVIGTRDLAMSATVDANGDGRVEIVVPSADRSTLRHIGFVGNKVREIAQFDLGTQIVGNLIGLGKTKVQVTLNGGHSRVIDLN
jgi:FG-GAP-like repeat